jgi:uncharacterized protein YlxW (UPF0749 family)
MLGFLIAIVVSGALYWVTNTLKDNTNALNNFEKQYTKEITELKASVTVLNESVNSMKVDFMQDLTQVQTDVATINDRVRTLEQKMAGQGSPNDLWFPVINNMQLQLNTLQEKMRLIVPANTSETK